MEIVLYENNIVTLLLSDSGVFTAIVKCNDNNTLKINLVSDIVILDSFKLLINNKFFISDVRYYTKCNITLSKLDEFDNQALVIEGYLSAAVLAIYKVYATETDYLKR